MNFIGFLIDILNFKSLLFQMIFKFNPLIIFVMSDLLEDCMSVQRTTE